MGLCRHSGHAEQEFFLFLITVMKNNNTQKTKQNKTTFKDAGKQLAVQIQGDFYDVSFFFESTCILTAKGRYVIHCRAMETLAVSRK